MYQIMKVLAVMGSPHRGASQALTERIENKLKEHGDVEFNYLHLKDADLKPCRGCFVCFLKGKEKCPLKDDKESIEKQIDEADGVIFVSPVYSMHVSYLMKLFIDRFSYTFHRPRYFGKYALALATTGNLGLKETLGYLKGVALCWGFEYVDQIGVASPPKPLLPLKAQRDRTDEVVKKFHQAMAEKRPRKLGLIDHLMFHSMRTVYGKFVNISPVPRDYTYWKERGMFEPGRKYYVEAVDSFFGNLIAKVLSWSMGRQVQKAIVQAKAG